MIRSVVIDRSANPLVVGPAIPVEVMTAAQAAGMPIVGKPMRVVRATNADLASLKYKSVGMRPIPIVVSTENTDLVGGPVQPVYVVSGILDTLEYTNKIIAMGPIGYWTQGESSGLISLDESGFGRNGVYTGVTLGQTGIGDGRTSASFDGATSYNNVFSTSLAAAFNNQEGTIIIWFKASAAGVWSDGVNRRLCRFAVDANNQVYINKSSSVNTLDIIYQAGGTAKGVSSSGLGASTAFNQIAITWSKSADQVKCYLNGVQIGSTTTGLGVWVGTLAATTTLIGAFVTTPSNVTNGFLAHAAVFNRPLSAAEVLSAATVLL